VVCEGCVGLTFETLVGLLIYCPTGVESTLCDAEQINHCGRMLFEDCRRSHSTASMTPYTFF
jgi:hypothetical protein